jgi:hypothetical protein
VLTRDCHQSISEKEREGLLVAGYRRYSPTGMTFFIYTEKKNIFFGKKVRFSTGFFKLI